ncbi:MAG: cyclic nucleotide-binding domain-containing protein [Pseudomonadota bacterium]
MKPIEVLKASRLFRNMPAHLLEKLAGTAIERTYTPGQDLVKQGTANRNIYLLGSGSVKVLKGQPGGSVEEVALLGAGTTLGEMAFVDGEPRSTSVEVIERAEVILLEHDKLRPVLDADAELRAAFFEAIAGLLTRRLRGATDDVATLRTVLKR